MNKQNSLLYLDGISVSFDGFKALNSLSLIVGEGEMRAIIGPNGAGKTTMMDVITGKTRPDAGEAIFGASVDLPAGDRHEVRHARRAPRAPPKAATDNVVRNFLPRPLRRLWS